MKVQFDFTVDHPTDAFDQAGGFIFLLSLFNNLLYLGARDY